MRSCLHGVWEYGKTILNGVRCLDFRRCVACGATEYKEQGAQYGD